MRGFFVSLSKEEQKLALEYEECTIGIRKEMKMTQWQPIESCPKLVPVLFKWDGNYYVDSNEIHITAGIFEPEGKMEGEYSKYHFIDPSATICDYFNGVENDYRPSHWAYLPKE